MSGVLKETEKRKNKEKGSKSDGGEDVNWSVPYDLIVEILSRLPVRSLLRFKTVCKQWCSLIQNHTYLSLEDNQNVYLFSLNGGGEGAYTFTTFLVKHDLPPYRTTVKAYSSGFVCYNTLSDKYILTNFWVCNLSTKQEIQVPLPPCRVFLDHDLDKFNSGFGFGFNPSTNDYTILVNSCGYGCYLFTLGTSSSWRKITSRPLQPCYLYNVETLSINGVLHWNTGCGIITLFDPKTEQFDVLSHPTYYKYSVFSRMDEFQGSLCLFSTDYDTCIFKLWILKDYNTNSWDYHCFILPHPLLTSCGLKNTVIVRNWEMVTVSSTSENGHCHCFLHSYNLHTCVSKKIELIGLSSDSNIVSIGDYKENIITLTMQ